MTTDQGPTSNAVPASPTRPVGRLTAALLNEMQSGRMSRNQLSIRSNVRYDLLRRFVRGQKTLTLETVDRIADALGLELVRRETQGTE